MNESLQTQVELYLSQLNGLIGRGRQLRESLEEDPSTGATIAATRLWQEHCGVTINQLSGGSKAHWLARSFSEAFLKRSAHGGAVEGVAPAEIVQRLLEVLERAIGALSRRDGVPLSTSPEPSARQFDFVHSAELRPILEQAYTENRRAFEQEKYDLALRTSCGILEAIVTDALEHRGPEALTASGAPTGAISDWRFETRLAIAEKAGLIRGGYARLPVAARTYRDHTQGKPERTIPERDARIASQVLHVVMRDLNPGR